MAFNEKLQKLLEEVDKVNCFNYDNVFTKNNEFKKQIILIQVKLKALLMEVCKSVVGCSVGYNP